jgi:hypothetical protein
MQCIESYVLLWAEISRVGDTLGPKVKLYLSVDMTNDGSIRIDRRLSIVTPKYKFSRLVPTSSYVTRGTYGLGRAHSNFCDRVSRTPG